MGSPPSRRAHYKRHSRVHTTSLHHLHTLGRTVHGEDWHKIGPQLVHTHTNGRINKSSQMTATEITALIGALQKEE